LNKIRILIADDIEETRSLLKQVLTLDHEHFEIVGEAGDGQEVIKLCGKLKPDIILMDINMPILNGLEATEQISNMYPMTDVIIMSVQSDAEYLKTAMAAGAKGYILKPINHEEVTDLIQKTYDRSSEFRSLKVNTESRETKLVSVYSFKGGVGKSVIALNLSVVLANKLNKRVLLVDLDLHFGDISLLTNKHMEKTILDFVDDGVDDYENMKGYLHTYCTNLDIMFAPLSPEGAEYISKDVIKKIFEMASEEYDYIIVDTGVNFEEHTLFALDHSDTVFFVSSMEMTSIKNSKLGLGVMKSLNYDEEKVKVIINKGNEKYGVSKKDVEKVFEQPAHAYLVEETKPIRMSVNRGSALALESKGKSTKFYKNLLKIAKEL
jgi:pilus assembly protein CpaE